MQRLDSIFKGALLLGLILFILAGCGTEPKFERDNENDPLSEEFVPDLPKYPNIFVDIHDNRNVELSWNIPNLYDGALLYKKYNENSERIFIDTLDATTNKYLDSTKKFTVGTSYSLKPFRQLSDSSIVYTEDEITKEIQFHPFKDMFWNYLQGTLVIFYDSDPRNSNFGFVDYYDGIDIYINRSSTDNREWEYLQTIFRGKFNNSSFDTDLSFELFDLNIRMDQFVYDDTTKVLLKSFSYSEHINSLTKAEFNFVDELHGLLQLETSIVAKDSVLIYSDVLKSSLRTSVSDIPIEFIQNYSFPFSFEITPFIGKNIGKPKIIGPFAPKLPSITLEGIEPISDNEIELSWSTSSNNDFSGFIIESLEENQSDFLPIDTVSSDNRKATIANLDINSFYDFKIRSYRSQYSQSLTVGYVNQLFIESQDELAYKGSKPKYSKNLSYIVRQVDYKETASSRDKTLQIQDLISGNVIEIELPLDEWGKGPSIIDYTLAESTNTIALIIDLDDVDVCCSYLLVFDLENEEYIIEQNIGYGSYKIQTLDNDSSFILFNHWEKKIFEVSPFHESYVIPKGEISIKSGHIVTIDHSNTYLNCNENDGVFLVNILTLSENIIFNEPCTEIKYQFSDNIIILRSKYDYIVIDLDTNTILNTYQFDDEFLPIIESTNYLKVPEIFIYHKSFTGPKAIIDDLHLDIHIPSLDENLLNAINFLEHQSFNRYKLITNDSELIIDMKKKWTKIE